MEDDDEENLKETQETEAEDDSLSTEEESAQTSENSEVPSSATDEILRLIAAEEEISRNARHTWRFPTVEIGLGDTIPIMGKTSAVESEYWSNTFFFGRAATGMTAYLHPKPVDCQLCSSSINGNLERVRHYLLEGVNPNHWCGDYSPLERAIDGKFLDVVRILLDAGADLRVPEFYEVSSPLKRAIMASDLNIMSLLLERGSDCNGDDFPLSFATRRRFEQGMRFLIDAGANLNDSCVGRNALYTAAENRYGDGAKLLLEAGANPRISDEDGCTPLHWAAGSGGDVVRILLEAGADPNVVHSYDLPALECSDTGEISKQPNITEETPLWLAITRKHQETVRTLLDFGADICLVPPTFDHKSCPAITEILKSIPSAVTLRTLCLRVIRTHQVDIEGWPPLLFLYPDEAEEYRSYRERVKKFEK